jgi:hypothetical protein
VEGKGSFKLNCFKGGKGTRGTEDYAIERGGAQFIELS